MIDRSVIGKSWPVKAIVPEEGALRFFAKATGETNPIYSDVSSAQSAGHPGLPVPPTYFFSLELLAPSDSFWLDDLGLPLEKILHAEQSFEYRKMVYAGEELKIETRRIAGILCARDDDTRFRGCGMRHTQNNFGGATWLKTQNRSRSVTGCLRM